MRRERLSWFVGAALLVGACSRSTPSAAPADSASAEVPSAPSDVAEPPATAERLPNGVASQVVAAGTGTVHPEANDCVRVRYTSWKRTAALHASANQSPETLCLRRAMPGLEVVLLRMVTGEQRRVWIPGELTYRTVEATRPAPNDDLTVDVELIDVLKSPPTPKNLDAPPASALRTASGLAREVLRPGSGQRRVLPAERLRVRLSAWTRDGALFESTELNGHPASVTRADVAPGVGEGLALMQIGEKVRLWVPAALAYGEHPRRGLPAGDLVYDVELLAIE